jgi:hypothetical protein
MQKRYSAEEIMTIGELFAEESLKPKQIAGRVNDTYHNGLPIRNEKSIHYILKKLFGTQKESE